MNEVVFRVKKFVLVLSYLFGLALPVHAAEVASVEQNLLVGVLVLVLFFGGYHLLRSRET